MCLTSRISETKIVANSRGICVKTFKDLKIVNCMKMQREILLLLQMHSLWAQLTFIRQKPRMSIQTSEMPPRFRVQSETRSNSSESTPFFYVIRLKSSMHCSSLSRFYLLRVLFFNCHSVVVFVGMRFFYTISISHSQSAAIPKTILYAKILFNSV